MTMQFATASRPCRGETVCGDQSLVLSTETSMLVAVVDGLGHGPHAAEAAGTACRTIRASSDLEMSRLMATVHDELTCTRGAAVTMLRIDPATLELEHAAIGNVEVAAVAREPIRLVSVPGVVGYRVRKIKVNHAQAHSGDLLVVHSDGISQRFELEHYQDLPLQDVADRLLDDWGKDHDDATCVAIRL